VIKVEAVWLAVEPLDMRLGTEAALARVVHVFGAARPHHAYLFANRRVAAAACAHTAPACNASVPDTMKVAR
jgi:hypothetical protein